MSDAVERLNAALEGRYAIERELGEGGMATVYLADDLKHERKVALKVLKPELAAIVGAERFLAEITTTANLTHPHILPLHDSGEADSFLFYVMPYVEGETLRDRIDREKQLPVDEAVALASKVAGALQHAHEHGVIHRDIKPANILLQDGEPVVSDFGIALAVGAAGSNRLTETGLSLGTPYYMSPEQATGDQAVGASTDTYALGCVLYEMLVGEPPYAGSSAQAVLGRIIAGKHISATEERPSVPANVDAAVRKALEKLPADRFASAQDFVRALGDEHFRYGEIAALDAGAAVGPWKRLTLVFAALTALFAGSFGWSLLRPEPPNTVTRFSVYIPADQVFDPVRGDFDLSADGLLMVYMGVGDAGQSQLWVKRLNALDATPIRDTDEARTPVISPDGMEVAFLLAGGLIRVVALEGGVSRTVTDEARCCPRWSPDGAWIYFNDPANGLSRVTAAGGGTPEIMTRQDTDAGETQHSYVDALPRGRGLVYTVSVGGSTDRTIQVVDLETGERHNLTAGRSPRYSSTGHLLFMGMDGTTLYAAPFDVDNLEMGTATPIAEDVLANPGLTAFYAISQTGRLFYRSGTAGGVTPVWVDRDGNDREVIPEWNTPGAQRNQSSLALSPDGNHLAIAILDSDSGVIDLWVRRLDTGQLWKVTFEGSINIRATWSPDGQSLRFISNRAGQNDFWSKRADGSGTAELLWDGEQTIMEAVYSPDEVWLIFREDVGTDVDDNIYALRPGVDSLPSPLLNTEFEERYPVPSPNGRWLAYVSNDGGQEEIFVSPFPDVPSGRVLVSRGGGTEPTWSRDGQELFYRNGNNELVAVQFTEDPTFVPGTQEILFSMNDYVRADGGRVYDVGLDGREFVMLRIDQRVGDTELIFVENWAEELRERLSN